VQAQQQPDGGDLPATRAALAGDPDARHRIVEVLARLPSLMHGRNARLGNRLRHDEVADAAQTAVLGIWRKLEDYDGRVPLLQWAYGFAVLELRRALERRVRRREVLVPVDPIARQGDAGVDAELLRREVASLNEVEQQAVQLKHFDAMTFAEIASRLGVSANTIKTRYYRAIDRLRARLRPRLVR